MQMIEYATVLAGAVPFKHNNNVNDTFRGQVLSPGGVKSAIIKDLNPQELANELLTLVLARALGLPVPEAFLAAADAADLALSKGPVLTDGRRLAFASVDAKTPALLFRLNGALSQADRTRIIEDLIVWAQLGELYGFDAWVANVDRHRGNLLFGGRTEVWLIDHGHCYTGPVWQPADLQPASEFRHRMSEWLTPHLPLPQRVSRAAQVSAFQPVVKALDLNKAAAAAHTANLLPNGHMVALVDFLTARVEHFVAHANRALGMLI